MKISDAIDALKTFFLDILGYFIPGFFAIIILGFSVHSDLKYNSKSLGVDSDWNGFLIVFFSYILGYVIYSISDFIDLLITRFKFLNIKDPNSIEIEIENSYEFELSKNALKELLIIKGQSIDLDANKLFSLKARNLRSIVMSYIPESDTKIYTFMFRAELCKNISSFSLFFGLFALLISLYNLFATNNIILNSGIQYIMSYVILVGCSYLLLRTRMRFLAIAYKIPFSIFLSKYFAIK